MDKYEHVFNIDYSDIGENHFLSNTGFLKFLQEAASMHSNSLNFGIEDLARFDLGWVIMNWKLKVLKRPKYEEKILIKTWLRKIDKLFFYRDFEVYNEDKEKIAVATSKWIWFNIKEKTVSIINDEVIKQYKPINEEAIPNFVFSRMRTGNNFENKFNYRIQRRDIDTNHHVNNLNYLDFAYETLPEDVYTRVEFNEVEIMYKNEIKINEDIECLYYKINEYEYIVTINSNSTNKNNAIIKLKSNTQQM